MTSNRPYLLRAIHAWICDNGMTPHIVVDAAKPGVEVPPQAINDGRVVLNLAPRAVSRLEIGNDVITFMARFGGVGHAVTVPVAAVQAIYARENGQGMLMVDDPPGTVAAGARGGAGTGTGAGGTRPPALQVVRDPRTKPGSGPAATPAPAAEPAPAPAGADGDPGKPHPKGKPSLHVVK